MSCPIYGGSSRSWPAFLPAAPHSAPPTRPLIFKRRSAFAALAMLLLLTGTRLLTGCATAPAEAANACRLLPLTSYSREAQRAVAAELATAPVAAAWPMWVQDYLGLRDAVRACQQ